MELGAVHRVDLLETRRSWNPRVVPPAWAADRRAARRSLTIPVGRRRSGKPAIPGGPEPEAQDVRRNASRDVPPFHQSRSGLAGQEVVQVSSGRSARPSPRPSPPEGGDPVVRRLVRPDVETPAARENHGWRVARVVGDEGSEQDLDPALAPRSFTQVPSRSSSVPEVPGCTPTKSATSISPSPRSAEGIVGFSQIAVDSRATSRWSSRDRIPRRSPIPVAVRIGERNAG